MAHSAKSALALGAALLLLGACSMFEDKPASTAEAAPAAAPAPEAAPAASPAAPDRAQPAASSPVRYACAGTKDALVVTHAATGTSARISFGKAAVNAKRSRAGHYTAARVDLVEKGNAATLTWRGKKYSCKARA